MTNLELPEFIITIITFVFAVSGAIYNAFRISKVHKQNVQTEWKLNALLESQRILLRRRRDEDRAERRQNGWVAPSRIS
jgi:hypothetical protein